MARSDSHLRALGRSGGCEVDYAEWLMRSPVRYSTLALAVVLMLALPARAQVPDGLRIDLPGPYPEQSTVEPPFDSGPAPSTTGIRSDPPRLQAAVSADLDGIFRYRFVGEHNFSLTGRDISFSDDVDCDGFAEVLVAAPLFRPGGVNYGEPGAVYLVSMADVEAADAADGAADGVIDFGLVAAQPRSWKLTSEGLHYVGTSVASGGDVNDDGCSDLLIGARPRQLQGLGLPRLRFRPPRSRRGGRREGRRRRYPACCGPA